MRFVGRRSKTGTAKVYVERPNGIWASAVTETTNLPARQDLVNHSPDGLEWGYTGSGPAQLALAMLVYALTEVGYRDPEAAALAHYQSFKFQVIAKLPRAGFRLPLDEVVRWFSSSPQQKIAATGQ